HDVGRRHQRGEDLLAALGAHVEAQALLAAVVDREVDALTAHHRFRAPGLLAAQFLDLDDLGAEIRQDHAAARPGLIPRQFQYPHALEGSGHALLPLATVRAGRSGHTAQLAPAFAACQTTAAPAIASAAPTPQRHCPASWFCVD